MPSSRLANGAAGSRFELPLLNLNFGRITDGTDIPPPPASPKLTVPTPPQTPPTAVTDNGSTDHDSGTLVAAAPNSIGPDNLSSSPSNGNSTYDSKPPLDTAPLSPAGSGRQGSLRRLFSKGTLNSPASDGQSTWFLSPSTIDAPRPQSCGTERAINMGKQRRTSTWFRRLRGDNPKRASIIYDAPSPMARKPRAPPPPMIPELSDLGQGQGSLGSDLFRNIK